MKVRPNDCLHGCTRHSLADMHPGEEKPDDLTNYSWHEVKFVKHAEDCPRRAWAITRGQQLAKAFGWEESA